MQQNASGGLRFVATRLMVATWPQMGILGIVLHCGTSTSNFRPLRISLLSPKLIQGTEQLPLVSLSNHMVNCEFRVAPWQALVRAMEIPAPPALS